MPWSYLAISQQGRFSFYGCTNRSCPPQNLSASLYQAKWSVLRPCKATVPQIADFFVYLTKERTLTTPAIKGYEVTLNMISALKGQKLSENLGIQFLLMNFDRSCHPRELKPPNQNVTLVLQSLTCPPNKPIKPFTPVWRFIRHLKSTPFVPVWRFNRHVKIFF